jgi:hypothetical protein
MAGWCRSRALVTGDSALFTKLGLVDTKGFDASAFLTFVYYWHMAPSPMIREQHPQLAVLTNYFILQDSGHPHMWAIISS